MSKTIGIKENVISVEYWRGRFEKSKVKVHALKPRVGIQAALCKAEPYYDSKVGQNEYMNVMRSKASIEKTQRAVLALEKYLDGLNKPPEVPRHLKKMHIPKKR